MPNDNIDRAVKRGAGVGADAVDYTTIMYEGYGPNGVALMIECLTDNKNRAAAEVAPRCRATAATLADPGSVAYNFIARASSSSPGEGTQEDDVLLAALEAGAERSSRTRRRIRGHHRRVRARPGAQGPSEAGLDYESADVEFVPNLNVEIDAEHRAQGLPAHRRPR